MRQIKFRVWAVANGEMFWPDEETYFIDGQPRIAPNTIWMQFTGLKDKNGNEIYEGDIVEEDADWWEVQYTDRAMFEALGINGGVDLCLDELIGSATVQGNIYENPDLIASK